jgi:26S proteasome regulatory subunit N9
MQIINIPQYPEFSHQVQSLIDQKLWLQLSQTLLNFFSSQATALPKNVKSQVYESVIKKFSNKLEGSMYVQLAILMEDLGVLRETAEECKGRGEQGLWLWASAAMVPHLLDAGKLDEAGAIISEAKAYLNSPEGYKTPLPGQALLYKSAADLAKVQADFDTYCVESLFYFNLIDADDNKVDYRRLDDFCIASLLSKTIYHFGDLLNVLNKFGVERIDPKLLSLIESFNIGDMKSFDKINTELIQPNPQLAQNAAFLKQKLALMALVELMFLSCRSTRVVQFAVIADYCRVGEDQVQNLLVKAMAVNLISGKINPLERVYSVERVSPRVLNTQQVTELVKFIQHWRTNIKQTLTQIEPILLSKQVKDL